MRNGLEEIQESYHQLNDSVSHRNAVSTHGSWHHKTPYLPSLQALMSSEPRIFSGAWSAVGKDILLLPAELEKAKTVCTLTLVIGR